METGENGVWIRTLTCKSEGVVWTGISQGLAQTAAIMQPSKSYYHCNGTEAWEERGWVCGRGREMRWKGGCVSLFPPSFVLNTHTQINLLYFIYLIATVILYIHCSTEVTPMLHVSLEHWNNYSDMMLDCKWKHLLRQASQEKTKVRQEMYNIKRSNNDSDISETWQQ